MSEVPLIVPFPAVVVGVATSVRALSPDAGSEFVRERSTGRAFEQATNSNARRSTSGVKRMRLPATDPLGANIRHITNIRHIIVGLRCCTP